MRVGDGPFTYGFSPVDEQVQVYLDLLAQTVAMGAHAFGVVEGKVERWADKRLSQTREQQTEVGVDFGGRAHGTAQVVAHALLVDDDGGR
ncbi:MAG: hypothetical protein BWY72_02271 [Bacteroidetes bacterium ADurb.Bin416]|nr:MAG: hypothetical protein BWY72_02271 [Bacteroidetes bacterium ADurb.Bin416]